MEDDHALRRKVVRHVNTLPDGQLRDVLRFIESLRTSDPSSPSIEEKIAAIVEDAGEGLQDVPSDGAEHHDHYIYGRPKQDS